MKVNVILMGVWLLIVGLNFFVKNSKAYWMIPGYEMQKDKRENVDWAGTANLLFYSSLIVFFIVLIPGLILPDTIFGKFFGGIVIVYALFVIIYSRFRYDHNKK